MRTATRAGLPGSKPSAFFLALVEATSVAGHTGGLHEGKKKGSGGLSDGAVAGIAVGCAVAGIAVGCVIGAVASQLIRRPKTPPELDPAKSNL